MAKKAASAVYEAAGIGPQDIKVVELHDCFATTRSSLTKGSDSVARAKRRSSSRMATTPYGGVS